MREGGVEPPSLAAQAPHACVSAISPPAHKLIRKTTLIDMNYTLA